VRGNLGVLALADTGLIFFILAPGYMPLWPGVAGPVLWILGWDLYHDGLHHSDHLDHETQEREIDSCADCFWLACHPLLLRYGISICAMTAVGHQRPMGAKSHERTCPLRPRKATLSSQSVICRFVP